MIDPFLHETREKYIAETQSKVLSFIFKVRYTSAISSTVGVLVDCEKS